MKVPHRVSETMSGYLLVVLVCNVLGALCANDTLEDVTTGNELWSGLVKDCKKPTETCVRSSIYDYLKDTLEYPSDVQLTHFLKFSKNSNNYTEAAEAAEDDRGFGDETPLEEMTRSLRDNSRKFLMTHDLELELPETFFMGTTLKVSPRSMEDSSGTLVKLELMKRDVNGFSSSVGEGRIFFKKIQDYIGERLLLAFLAILVVIKLLAVKILFVLPAIIGVAAAKKLILKIVLFLFPALHHLFKLCAYTPYGAKHHIHKHQISHIHQVAASHKNHPYKHHYEEGPPGYHYEGGPPGHHFEEGYGGPEGSPDGPYFGNEIISHRRDPEDDNAWGQGQDLRRPKPDSKKPLTPTEIENIVLKAEKEALIKSRLQREKQRIHEENLRLQLQLNNALKFQEKLKQQTAFYSAKVPPGVKPRFPSPPSRKPPGAFAEPPANFGAASLQPPLGVNQAVRAGAGFQNGGRVQQSTGGVDLEGFRNAVGLSGSVVKGDIGAGLPGEAVQAVQNFVKQKTYQAQQHVYPVYNQIQPGATFQHEGSPKQPQQEPPVQIVKSIEVTKAVQEPEPQGSFEFPQKPTQNELEADIYKAASVTYDPFYSPILDKIDDVLSDLGFVEEPCKERLICSMYKDPARFSPHSNLLSAELSRDSTELKKPSSTNAAVIRFYKYVQAARDGQDKRDCIRLYPACAVNTEVEE